MRTRSIIITIVAALLLFSPASHAVFAKENGNLIDDPGKYAFCFGNVTNNEHTESRGCVLNI